MRRLTPQYTHQLVITGYESGSSVTFNWTFTSRTGAKITLADLKTSTAFTNTFNAITGQVAMKIVKGSVTMFPYYFINDGVVYGYDSENDQSTSMSLPELFNSMTSVSISDTVIC